MLPVNELYSSICYSGAVVLLNRLSYTTTIWRIHQPTFDLCARIPHLLKNNKSVCSICLQYVLV